MTAPLAEVAPIAPVAGWFVVGMWAFLACIVLMGLLKGYDRSLGALLIILAERARGIRWVGGTLAGAIDSANHAIRQVIASGINATQSLVAKWFHASAWIVNEVGDAIADLADGVHDAIDGLVHGAVPNAVRTVTRPIKVNVGALRQQIRAVERHAVRRLNAVARSLEAEISRDFGLAHRGIDHMGARLLARIKAAESHAASDVAALRRTVVRGFGRRLTRVEKLVLGSAISAVALATLTRVFPYWRCTNVRRFNRNVCRSPIGSLDWLFALTGAVVLAVDLEAAVHVGTDTIEFLTPVWEEMIGTGSE